MSEIYIIETPTGKWEFIRVQGIGAAIRKALGKSAAKDYEPYATAGTGRSWTERPWRYLKLVPVHIEAWLFMQGMNVPMPRFHDLISVKPNPGEAEADLKVFDPLIQGTIQRMQTITRNHARREVSLQPAPIFMYIVAGLLGALMGFIAAGVVK